MGSSKHIVLVHKAMRDYRYSNPVAIMVTPQFYTLKRVELPVKYLYQVKKLAPSIMEELLPDAREYSYYIYKEESGEDTVWVIIAYDPYEIAQFIESRGIGSEQVTKLYFAQRSSERFEHPSRLSEHEVITVMENTVVVLPAAVFEEPVGTLRFDENLIPDDGVGFNISKNALVDFRSAVIIASIIGVFALLWLAEGIRYEKMLADISRPLDELLEQNPALQSGYARENISKRYHKIDKEERAKRDVLKNLSKLGRNGVELESLKLDDKKFNASFLCKDEQVMKQILAAAQKKKYKTDRNGNELVLKVEGTL